MRETDVARPIIPWLEARGWDVYQEVSGYDIVAVVGHIIWIVETKTSLSTKLCAQAFDRCHHAHYVSVGIPATEKRDDGHEWARRQLANAGIGVIEVHPNSRAVYEREEPRLNRRPPWASSLVDRLRPEHKTYLEAGSPCGGGWTPWKDTCQKIARHVAQSPGITLKELLEADGRYHYSSKQSARSSLSRWILDGKVPGIECRQDGRKLRLYATGMA